MPIRLRRTGARTLALRFKTPIDSRSRSIVEAEVERMRHSVIPIIGEDSLARPFVVGSAVVLVYSGRKVLVTAEHVLSDSEKDKVPLGFFGADGYSRSFGGEFVISAAHDLAVKLLAPDEIIALSHIPFLAERDLLRAAAVEEHFYASVTGYPATAAEVMDRLTLDTKMDVYSNFAKEKLDGTISVHFNKKEGAKTKTGHVTPHDPFGKSGGAIFGLPVHGRYITPNQQARLVGIAIRWKRAEKLIQGSSIALLTPLLDRLVGNAASSATRADKPEQGEERHVHDAS